MLFRSAVLLAPLLDLDYLLSWSNIFLHSVTALLALIAFILDDYVYPFKAKNMALFGVIMPFLYSIYFFIRYEVAGKMPAQYFFLDYKKVGWVSISSQGIGVIYWLGILCVTLFVIGTLIIWLKQKCSKKPVKTILLTFGAMLFLSLLFSALGFI